MERKTIENGILFAEVISYLRKGHTTTIPVKGSSMFPFIVEGKDLVVLEGAEAGSPEGGPVKKVKVDDIVLFVYRGMHILHRVTKIENGIVTFRGDGNFRGEEFCTPENIYGKAITILKNGEIPFDPYSKKALRKLRAWNFFYPVRRYILAIYRRLPGFLKK